MKRKRKAVPADPGFVAYIADVERQHREARASVTGTGVVEGNTVRVGPDPGVGPVTPTTIHRHEWSGEPYRTTVHGVSWWERRCAVCGPVGLRPVGRTWSEDDGVPPPETWWVR